MNHMNTAEPCRCGHHKVVPVLIILMGLVFLAGFYGIFSAGTVAVAWPIILIAIGAVKLGSGSCKCYACNPQMPS